MCERQLVFGQLPLLQIDGHEIVQSQAAVRYLAKKAGLQGRYLFMNDNKLVFFPSDDFGKFINFQKYR